VVSFNTVTGLPFPPFLVHINNAKLYYPGLHARLAKAMAREVSLAKTSIYKGQTQDKETKKDQDKADL
jgi:hypothetical protein